jgi:two-component system OmpR family sensor kinase
MSEASPAGRPVPLLAVDASGVDLLGRAVPDGALARARQITAEGAHPRAARLTNGPAGEQYLLFVPIGAQPLRGSGAPPSPWLLIVMAALASVAVSALLAWYLARPIQKLRWAFEAAASGRLDTRVSSLMGGRRDEIADLGHDFDRMARRLQSLMSAQKRLLHDVSHELRSPLARLQAAVGLLRQDPGRLELSLDRIEKESTRLDAMVGEVLTLARLESGSLGSGAEPISMAELVAGICEDAKFEAEAANKSLTFECSADAAVRGEAELLHRAIENVVRNAVKYTRVGTNVEISMRVDRIAKRVSIIVCDEGPGIPPSDLDKVFMPFYRGGANANAPGFGLGLAIAHGSIVAHGGAIAISNGSKGGLVVDMKLPLA